MHKDFKFTFVILKGK